MEKALGSEHSSFTRVTEILIQQDSKDELRLSEAEIAGLQKFTEQIVEVRLPIQIAPTQKARVRVSTQSVVSDNVQILVMNVPTVNLDLTVTHPENMVIRGLPLHPSSASFVTEVNTPTLSRWRINNGILPYQGIELSWSSNPPAL